MNASEIPYRDIRDYFGIVNERLMGRDGLYSMADQMLNNPDRPIDLIAQIADMRAAQKRARAKNRKLPKDKRIPAKVLRTVHSMWHDVFMDAVLAGEWLDAAMHVGKGDMIYVFFHFWPHIAPARRATAFGDAISSGEYLYRDRFYTVPLLDDLHAAGELVLDDQSDNEEPIDARARFDALPDTLTIWRGTHEPELESQDYGISWTLNELLALWFARRPGVSQERPVILEATIPKSEIRGLLLGRDEDEVLITPKGLRLAEGNVVRWRYLNDDDHRRVNELNERRRAEFSAKNADAAANLYKTA